jgi:hypothetical protein
VAVAGKSSSVDCTAGVIEAPGVEPARRMIENPRAAPTCTVIFDEREHLIPLAVHYAAGPDRLQDSEVRLSKETGDDRIRAQSGLP